MIANQVLFKDTFTATYRISTDSLDEAKKIAKDICVEQTVEFPIDLITDENILQNIVGKVLSVNTYTTGCFDAKIAYAADTVGGDFVQFLNVLFGNTGLKPKIKLTDFTLPDSMKTYLKGPKFGVQGIRNYVGVNDRPLLATALKPMGLSNTILADYARQYTEGGIDIIKDDHGLVDQPFNRFEDRVRRCSEAVNEANERFSKKCMYVPNITGPFDRIVSNAIFAKENGAHGIMLAPGLTGFDAMRALRNNDELSLPILSHPAFLGPLAISSQSGTSQGVLFGKINRAAGADIAIFPSYGGRFAVTEEDCKDIATCLLTEDVNFAQAFPAPAGGMTVDRAPALMQFYGKDAVLLIGGDLHRHGKDLVSACKKFTEKVFCNLF